jgi:hypothetical protein
MKNASFEATSDKKEKNADFKTQGALVILLKCSIIAND